MVLSTWGVLPYMRRRLFMFNVVLFLSSWPCAAQHNISLDCRNVRIEWVLAQIRDAGGYSLEYAVGLLEQVPRFDIHLMNASPEQAFRACLAGLNLHAEIRGKNVVIKGDAGTLLFANLRGRVMDAQRQPLAGATVAIEGTTVGVETDAAGQFSLPVKTFWTHLTISYTGFKTSRDSFSNQQIAEIKLQPTELDKAVVTPYAKTAPRFSPATFYSLKAADIDVSPVHNLIEAMAGRVPGVSIRQVNGVPGSAAQLSIDGRHSIQQGNDPLIVIDGVPWSSNGFLSTIGGGTAQGPFGASALNGIPPTAIDEIGVMKDAAATALYGSRASNGVILITLKQGVSGKLRFTAGVSGGETWVVRTSPLLNTPQFLQLRQEAILNDVRRGNDTSPPERARWDPRRYTDFKQTTVGGTGLIRDAHVDCSGGSINTWFLLSGHYYKESTVFPDASYDQDVSVYGNLHHQSTNKRLRLGFSELYNWEDIHLPKEDYSQFQYLAPNAPPFTDAAGNLQWGDSTMPFVNIPAKAHNTYAGRMYTIFGHAEGSYELARYFFAEVRVGYNAILTREQSVLRAAGQPSVLSLPSTDQASFANNDYSSSIVEGLGTYIGPLGRQGSLDAAIGITYQAQRTAYASWQEPEPGGGAIGSDVDDALVKNGYQALFARATYVFRKTWVLSASQRRDGSSKFGAGYRYGDFGSVAAAWIFRQDKNCGKCKGLSFGKIKGSYGTTGNDQISPQLYNTTTAPLIRNNLRWELNYRAEVGLDLRFFQDRFAFSVNVFRSWTHNQMIFSPGDFLTGSPQHFSDVLANVRNEGLEFLWQVSDLRLGKFLWTSQLTVTIPRNILKSFPLLDSSSFAATLEVGRSLTSTKGYHLRSVDPQSGLYVFQGMRSSPSLDPNYFAGWSHTLKYWHLELDFFLEWRRQNGYNPLAALDLQNAPGAQGSSQLSNGPVEWLRHWQMPYDHSAQQRLTAGTDSLAMGALQKYTQSDGAVTGGSYLRVKTISLSYQWKADPEKKGRHLQGISIFLKGENLWTVSHFPVTDPETQDPLVLPPLRVLTAGITITY